jgi:hypothetical protein
LVKKNGHAISFNNYPRVSSGASPPPEIGKLSFAKPESAHFFFRAAFSGKKSIITCSPVLVTLYYNRKESWFTPLIHKKD